MDMYEEENRVDFYARIRAAAQLLKVIYEDFEAASRCEDYTKARDLVDRAMNVARRVSASEPTARSRLANCNWSEPRIDAFGA